jgi:hypothetical protein
VSILGCPALLPKNVDKIAKTVIVPEHDWESFLHFGRLLLALIRIHRLSSCIIGPTISSTTEVDTLE